MILVPLVVLGCEKESSSYQEPIDYAFRIEESLKIKYELDSLQENGWKIFNISPRYTYKYEEVLESNRGSNFMFVGSVMDIRKVGGDYMVIIGYSFLHSIREALGNHLELKCDSIQLSSILSYKGKNWLYWDEPDVVVVATLDRIYRQKYRFEIDVDEEFPDMSEIMITTANDFVIKGEMVEIQIVYSSKDIE